MITIQYNVTGTPEKAAADAIAFFNLIPENMRGAVKTLKTKENVTADDCEQLRGEYLATFGQRFRLLKGQNPENVRNIIQACISAGKDNKTLHAGEIASGEISGERFEGEIDLDDPAAD